MYMLNNYSPMQMKMHALLKTGWQDYQIKPRSQTNWNAVKRLVVISYPHLYMYD